IGYFDPNCHLIPPLRSQRDREALARGLAEGRINALCSDHTPVDDDGKQTPFAESEPGATGLELLLPLTLKWADMAGLSLLDGLARITSNAARIVGITKAGHLSVGARADVCVFDPAAHVVVTRESLKSQGKNTPFLGMELPGKVHCWLVEGQVMFEGGVSRVGPRGLSPEPWLHGLIRGLARETLNPRTAAAQNRCVRRRAPSARSAAPAAAPAATGRRWRWSAPHGGMGAGRAPRSH